VWLAELESMLREAGGDEFVYFEVKIHGSRPGICNANEGGQRAVY
jgi:hypothetical protein